MKRRMYFWHDDGTIEFSPPAVDVGMSDIKEILEEETYEELAIIDDEGLVKNYVKTYYAWQEAKQKIEEEMYRCTYCSCWNFRNQTCHYCGNFNKNTK